MKKRTKTNSRMIGEQKRRGTRKQRTKNKTKKSMGVR
jgi:hypothetical protein